MHETRGLVLRETRGLFEHTFVVIIFYFYFWAGRREKKIRDAHTHACTRHGGSFCVRHGGSFERTFVAIILFFFLGEGGKKKIRACMHACMRARDTGARSA